MYAPEGMVKNPRGKGTLLDYGVAARYGVVPIENNGGPLLLATSVEHSVRSYRELRFLLRRDLLLVRVSEEQHRDLVVSTWSAEERSAGQRAAGGDSGFRAKVRAEDKKKNEGQVAHLTLDERSSGSGVVRRIDQVFSRAIAQGVSDIHFEPHESELKVRFRLDGVLQPVQSLEKARQNEVVSRLKILAGMDIAEKRRPQDGRIMVEGADKAVDVRVSSMPTPHGEKVVLRLLDKSRQPLDLKALGMEGRNLDMFEEAIRKPHGMILVTGPTGSGKTTTLYAALQRILSPRINISTVEDPIEYQLAGINQTQMHADIGYTFAAAVRTFLRQDPDVIMIGEIRDTDTAKYAIQAAQTGHLVFSTLHTNDAPSAIVRLLEMGMEPYLVASTVHLIMAQRLVRRICPACARMRKLSKEEVSYLRRDAAELEEVHEGAGCGECSQTGFRGRIGIYEIMPVSGTIQDMVVDKVSTQKVREQALEEGMRSLRGEGLRLAKEGMTSLSELRAVVG